MVGKTNKTVKSKTTRKTTKAKPKTKPKIKPEHLIGYKLILTADTKEPSDMADLRQKTTMLRKQGAAVTIVTSTDKYGLTTKDVFAKATPAYLKNKAKYFEEKKAEDKKARAEHEKHRLRTVRAIW